MADYVNNKELFEVSKTYYPLAKAALDAGEERPPIPEEYVSAIMRICRKMANLHNFIGYSYKEDMISDAILKCFQKAHLFNPERSENMFAYLSQITWHAYIGRIKEEQKQNSVRARLINEKITSEFVEQHLDHDQEATNAFVDFLKENEIFVDYFEQRKMQGQTGLLHPSLRHRNLTPYTKNEKTSKNKVSSEVNIFELTEE